MIFDHPPSSPIFGTFYYLIKRGRIEGDRYRLFDKDMFALRKAIAAIFIPRDGANFHRYDWAMVRVTVEQISNDPRAGALIKAVVMKSPAQDEMLLSRIEPRLEDGSVKIDTKADIRVDKAFMGWGGGRFMMSHAIRWAKAYHNDRRIVGLYIKDEDRVLLLKFYEPFGFRWQTGLNRGDAVPVADLIESLEGTYWLSSNKLLEETWKAMGQMHYYVEEMRNSVIPKPKRWITRVYEAILRRVSTTPNI